MKKVLLVILLAFMYANPSLAQSDSLTREVGFSTQIILNNIFSSHGGPVSLMLKKQKGDNTWKRYGADLLISRNEHIDFSHKYTSEASVFMPSWGIEKRKPAAEKWVFLYGADAIAELSRYRTEQVDSYNPETERIRTTERYTYGAGIRPFIGISYFISPRLYLSTEASASLSGSWSSIKGTDTHYNNTPRNLDDDAWRFALGFRPASAIFVYYRF